MTYVCAGPLSVCSPRRADRSFEGLIVNQIKSNGRRMPAGKLGARRDDPDTTRAVEEGDEAEPTGGSRSTLDVCPSMRGLAKMRF